MKLERIQFVHFRNHESLIFEPDGGVNLIYGLNGSGKTSVLEGVHYCALTKGFVNAHDNECLSSGKPFFLLKGVFADSYGKKTEVNVTYSPQEGKQLTVNGQSSSSFSSHVGSVPCITFSPADIAIINGSPAERRRFLDNAICQTDRGYLDALLQYRRILQQRNSLFLRSSGSGPDPEMMDILADQMAFPAARVTARRVQFVREILPFLRQYLGVVSGGEYPSIEYRSSFLPPGFAGSPDQLAVHFRNRIGQKRHEEIARSQTSAGPHRDDVVFYLHEREIKKYASQGQKRSFLIALKLALYRYFTVKSDEEPICLFDDLFSELDSQRIDSLLHLLVDSGQIIITATEQRTAPAVNTMSIQGMA